MKGPEPIGCSAKFLVFSARSLPGAAISSFSGTMPALKVASASRIDGSGCDRCRMTVSVPAVSTLWMELSRNWKPPPVSFFEARSSDHLMSLSSSGEPSANFTPWRIFSVIVLPSALTVQLSASAGWMPLLSRVGWISVS